MEEEEQEQPDWGMGIDDDYDAHNDETFGGTGEEYTWEDAQAVFEDLPKTVPDTLQPSNGASNGYNKGSSSLGATKDTVHDPRTTETEYYDYDNDNALLEESISRLVLDDMDTDDEDEERKMKLSRLGATSNYSTYFMPPQVASKHLHWLMDKELPGGSLLGSSVWSMHPTSTPSDPPAPVPQLQPITPNRTPNAGFSNIIKHTPRQNHLSNDDPLMNESNVSKFFGGVPTSTPKVPTALKKPVFKTVEELERELLEDGSTPVSQMGSNLMGDSSPKPESKPKILMAEDLERELIQGSPSSAPKSSEYDNSTRSPLHVLSQLNQVFNTEPSLPSQNQCQMPPQHMVHQSLPPNAAGLPPSNVNFNNLAGGPTINGNTSLGNVMLMEQQKLLLARQALLQNASQSGPGVHQNFVPSSGPAQSSQIAQNFHGVLTPMQHQQQQQQHQHQHLQQQQMRLHQLNSRIRARMSVIMPIAPSLPHIRPHLLPHVGFVHPQQISSAYKNQMMKTDDPYRGLMTEKDKQRLRNIQIIQLQNDHPFTTDYYSLMFKVKHTSASEQLQQRQLLSKLYPKRDDENNSRNQYEPARFENSLGKLQAVSALAPKRVMDAVIRVTECRNASRTGIKAYRYLLLEIEKLYECLLTMEEADIRVAILCNADEKDLHRRTKIADKMNKILTNKEKLFSLLSVKKGKMLICRLLPLTESSLRYRVIGHLLDIFPLWGIDQMEFAFPYLRHCIFHGEIRDMLTIVASVTDNNIFESIVMTKLGISVVTCIFHHAENLLNRCEPMLMEDLESHWTRKSVFGILAMLIKHSELAEPVEIYPNILQHVRRFALHNRDFLLLEAAMQRWVASGVPVRQ